MHVTPLNQGVIGAEEYCEVATAVQAFISVADTRRAFWLQRRGDRTSRH